ncbi:MAG: type II secretion system F family protein [archaeon]|jgi:flagellar protein FlaJ|nr:type II secretion system F family protein [archaeon]
MTKKKKGIQLKFLKKYKQYIKYSGLNFSAETWILLALGAGIAAGAITLATIALLGFMVSPLLAFIVTLVVLDLLLGWPYIKAMARVNAIEETLPDALKQMADTLKAGGTYEYALREIASSQYGALTNEMELVLRRLEEGENLENSLKRFSDNIDSRLIKRSMAVVIDSLKAGAGLADVLDEIAEDIRAMHRLGKQRKTDTTLQVLFMIAAGAFVAPVIFGLVSSIIQLFIQATSGLGASVQEKEQAFAIRDLLVLLMQIYILIEVTASGIMISLMRDGRVSKSIIYIPILLLVAYLAYYVSVFVTGGIIGGVA